MRILFPYLVFYLLMIGCAPIYIPNSRNIPSVNDVNEAQFTGMFGTSGWDVNTLYNFHKNIGVMVNGSFAHHTRKSGRDNIEGPRFHKHLFGETGIGYYNTLGSSRSTIAFYSGVGWGESFSDNTNFFDKIIYQKGRYRRYFLQPSVSLKIKDIHLGFGWRFSNIYFQRFETQDGLQDLPNKEWFSEFVMEISVEMENFDFVSQAGVNKPLNNQEVVFHYRPFHVSVGIRYNLTRGKE